MSDLAELLRDWRLTECEHTIKGPVCCSPCLRDRILASDWFFRIRARERAEAAAEGHRAGYRAALADAAHDLEIMRDFDSQDRHVIRQRLLDKARRAARIRSDAGIGGGGDGPTSRVITTPGGGELTEQGDGTWRITKPDERAWTPGEAR